MGDVVGKVFVCEVGGSRGDVEADEAENRGVRREERRSAMQPVPV